MLSCPEELVSSAEMFAPSLNGPGQHLFEFFYLYFRGFTLPIFVLCDSLHGSLSCVTAFTGLHWQCACQQQPLYPDNFYSNHSMKLIEVSIYHQTSIKSE